MNPNDFKSYKNFNENTKGIGDKKIFDSVIISNVKKEVMDFLEGLQNYGGNNFSITLESVVKGFSCFHLTFKDGVPENTRHSLCKYNYIMAYMAQAGYANVFYLYVVFDDLNNDIIKFQIEHSLVRGVYGFIMQNMQYKKIFADEITRMLNNNAKALQEKIYYQKANQNNKTTVVQAPKEEEKKKKEIEPIKTPEPVVEIKKEAPVEIKKEEPVVVKVVEVVVKEEKPIEVIPEPVETTPPTELPENTEIESTDTSVDGVDVVKETSKKKSSKKKKSDSTQL
jgi:hypothetical protein